MNKTTKEFEKIWDEENPVIKSECVKDLAEYWFIIGKIRGIHGTLRKHIPFYLIYIVLIIALFI